MTVRPSDFNRTASLNALLMGRLPDGEWGQMPVVDILALLGIAAAPEALVVNTLLTDADMGKEFAANSVVGITLSLPPAAAAVNGVQPAGTVPIGSSIILTNVGTGDVTIARTGPGHTIDALPGWISYAGEQRVITWIDATTILSKIVRPYDKEFTPVGTPTFINPPGYTFYDYDIRGPGSGGGGGAKQASGLACSGGPGGSAGYRHEGTVSAGVAGAVRSINIPDGGLGGPGATADSTVGSPGAVALSDTTCTGLPTAHRAGAPAGGQLAANAASGSSASPVAAGASATGSTAPTTPSGATPGSTANGNGGQHAPATGGGGNNGAAGNPGGHAGRTSAGGGSGGGLGTGTGGLPGGAPGIVPLLVPQGTTLAGQNGAAGTLGANGLGSGGAGGGSSETVAGSGGEGGPGAGGGGGGSARNGGTAGSGGKGGKGYLRLRGRL